MQITKPFPQELAEDLYHRLLEYPQANMDDSITGPFTIPWVMERLRTAGDTWLISNDAGQPAGLVCFQPEYPWKGRLHGICFGRGLMPPERKRDALKLIIGEIFGSGVEKISAQHFATNRLIGPFLKDLGFRQEGYLKAETRQGGQPVDVVQVALFRCP